MLIKSALSAQDDVRNVAKVYETKTAGSIDICRNYISDMRELCAYA